MSNFIELEKVVIDADEVLIVTQHRDHVNVTFKNGKTFMYGFTKKEFMEAIKKPTTLEKGIV